MQMFAMELRAIVVRGCDKRLGSDRPLVDARAPTVQHPE